MKDDVDAPRRGLKSKQQLHFLRASNVPSRCEGLLLDNVESRQVIVFKVSRTEIVTDAEMSKSSAP